MTNVQKKRLICKLIYTYGLGVSKTKAKLGYKHVDSNSAINYLYITCHEI